MTRHFENDV